MEEYQSVEIDGLPGLHTVYTLSVPKKRVQQHVLERTVMAGGTAYCVRFVDDSGKDARMPTFVRSGDAIHIRREDETEEVDTTKLVLYGKGDGLTICMMRGMKTQRSKDYTMFCFGDDCALYVTRESFADYAALGTDAAAMTLAEYGELIQRTNGMSEPFSPDAYGNLSSTYTSDVNGRVFLYYATVRKGTDACWLIHLACPAELQSGYLPQFAFWANTIAVN